MSSLHDQWLNFYRHSGTDHRNRCLVDIWTMTFDELEKHHDFIQWLFPLPEASSVNPHAPLLTAELIQQTQQDSEVSENLLRSFDTMAAFWGFNRNNENDIIRSAQFDIQSQKWCCTSNHNQLRLTRVLKSLSLLGHPQIASRTCEFLLMEVSAAGLNLNHLSALPYWINAIESVEELELSMDDFSDQA